MNGDTLLHSVSELGFDVTVDRMMNPVIPHRVQHPSQNDSAGWTCRRQTTQTMAPKHTTSQAHKSLEAKEAQSLTIVPDAYHFNSEIHEQKLVRRIIRTGMTVFDVGAHIGKYTKLFSILVGNEGKVYAFEPCKRSFTKLVSAVKEYNFTNVTLFNKAVFGHNQKVILNEFPEAYSSWNSLGLPEMGNPIDPMVTVPIERSVEVEAVTLDSFCEQYHVDGIDYLKLDVEGSELDVLIGASRLLENKAIRYLQFEISKPMLKGCNTQAKFVFDFLESKGYECHTINDDGTIGDILSDSDSFYENYIALPTVSTGGRSPKSLTSEGFTEGDLWTPETYMRRAIMDWLSRTFFEPSFALSIDKNPSLDEMIIRRWPGVTIDRAVYPEYDAQDLSRIADNQYDLVYSNQILEHIPKPWVAAAEMVRVLKPGGLGLHTTCAFNPRHGPPAFNDYYRFLPDGLAELFEGVKVLVKAGWGNRQALLYNLGVDDGHGDLGGRRFCEHVGKRNDERYPWHVWIIFEKSQTGGSIEKFYQNKNQKNI